MLYATLADFINICIVNICSELEILEHASWNEVMRGHKISLADALIESVLGTRLAPLKPPCNGAI